jgi:hypothetical protein
LLQQLSLPWAKLIGVNPVLAGQLVERMLPLGRFHGQLKLERRAVLLALLAHQNHLHA